MHAVSTYVNGCELDKLSTKDFDRYHDTEINYRLREGYGALFVGLAREMPVTYECRVRRIDHSRTAIRIETTQGELDARAVILCVSTNILATESIARPGHWDKRAVLAEPVENRLFFAGEATSPHFFSTAHGAFESGLRAADEAIQALAGKSLTSG